MLEPTKVPLAVIVVKAPELAELAPTVAPSMEPPLMSMVLKVSIALSKKVSKSYKATCTIVPLSLSTTLSAAARVVLVADVSPSTILSSAAVDAIAVPLKFIASA